MGQQARIFGNEIEPRRLRCIDCRYFIEQVCQPHELSVIGQIQAKHGVVDHLVAYIDFLDKRFFGKMEQRTAYVKVFVELILQIQAEKGLTLCGEHRLVFEAYTDILPGVDNRLVGDCDYTHGIVHGIVGILCKLYTSRGHYYRTSRHIHGIESYL